MGALRLDDPPILDLREPKPRADRSKRLLVRHAQHDRVGAIRQISRAAFPCGVNQVRGEDAEREVSANDHVVSESATTGLFTRAPFRRLTESSRSCANRIHAIRSRQGPVRTF